MHNIIISGVLMQTHSETHAHKRKVKKINLTPLDTNHDPLLVSVFISK